MRMRGAFGGEVLFRRNFGLCSLYALINALPTIAVIGIYSTGDRRFMNLVAIIAAFQTLALAVAAGCSIRSYDAWGSSVFAKALKIAMKARAVMVGLSFVGLGVGACGFKPAFVAAIFLAPDALCRWAAWSFGRSVWRTHNLHEHMPNSDQTDLITEYLVSLLTFSLLSFGVLGLAGFLMIVLRHKERRSRGIFDSGDSAQCLPLASIPCKRRGIRPRIRQ